MVDRSPIIANAVGGRVLIDVDPDSARDLMRALWMAHEANEHLQQDRPGWWGDVIELLVAAGEADAQTGTLPAAVYVPVMVPERPALRLVPGGEAS